MDLMGNALAWISTLCKGIMVFQTVSFSPKHLFLLQWYPEAPPNRDQVALTRWTVGAGKLMITAHPGWAFPALPGCDGSGTSRFRTAVHYHSAELVFCTSLKILVFIFHTMVLMFPCYIRVKWRLKFVICCSTLNIYRDQIWFTAALWHLT